MKTLTICCHGVGLERFLPKSYSTKPCHSLGALLHRKLIAHFELRNNSLDYGTVISFRKVSFKQYFKNVIVAHTSYGKIKTTL